MYEYQISVYIFENDMVQIGALRLAPTLDMKRKDFLDCGFIGFQTLTWRCFHHSILNLTGWYDTTWGRLFLKLVPVSAFECLSAYWFPHSNSKTLPSINLKFDRVVMPHSHYRQYFLWLEVIRRNCPQVAPFRPSCSHYRWTVTDWTQVF